MNSSLNKYLGILVGLAVGDVLGTPFEFWKKDKVREYFKNKRLGVKPFKRGEVNYPAGFYSDDTSQMICLAESLTENGFNIHDQRQKYVKWFLEGYATPDGKTTYGIGQHTIKQLIKPNRIIKTDGLDKLATGNGSLMRCAPIGLYFQGDYEKIKKYSLLSSYATHNNKIAGWCCVILNAYISLIIDGVEKDQLNTKILSLYKNIPSKVREIIVSNFNKFSEEDIKTTGYCVDTLRIALWAFAATNDFKGCMRKIILLGGDVDTYGAAAGAIAGCYYGYAEIPKEWGNKVMRINHIKTLAKKLYYF